MESFVDPRTLIQSTRFQTNEIFLQLSLIREKIFKLAIVIEHEEIVFLNISLKNRTTLFIQQVEIGRGKGSENIATIGHVPLDSVL